MANIPMEDSLRKALQIRLSELKAVCDSEREEQQALESRLDALEREIALTEGLLNENGHQRPAPALGTSLRELEAKPLNRAPASITFPSGERARLGQWNRLLVEVAKYLKEQGLFERLELPVKPYRARRVLVSHEARHRDLGKDFFLPVDLGDGFWLETHASAQQLVAQTKWLVSACGEDPAEYVIHV